MSKQKKINEKRTKNIHQLSNSYIFSKIRNDNNIINEESLIDYKKNYTKGKTTRFSILNNISVNDKDNSIISNSAPLDPLRKESKLYKVNNLVPQFELKYKVPKCAYITKKNHSSVYVCDCSLDRLVIICEECKDKCHFQHNLIEIPNKNLNFTCNCGEERHEFPEYSPVKVNKSCLLSIFLKSTSPRISVYDMNTNRICGFCYVHLKSKLEINQIQSPVKENKKKKNTNQFKFKPFNDSLQKEYTILDEVKDIGECKYNESDYLPIQGLMTYANLLFEFKNGNYYLRHFLLEHNINLLSKTDEIFKVFNNVLTDLKNYSLYLKEDNSNEEQYMLEDIDLFRVYVNIFSILMQEKNFKYIEIVNIFGFLSLQDVYMIVKYKLDALSSKALNNKHDDEYIYHKHRSYTYSTTVIEITNEMFFTIYNFYIYIRNFLLKYNNDVNIETILNMTIYQRYYYIHNCLLFGKGYLNETKQKDVYKRDYDYVKASLEFIPESIIEWLEKVLNSNLYIIFREDLNLSIYITDVFCFLFKFNLIEEENRFKFYYILFDILTINIERSKKKNLNEIHFRRKASKGNYLIILPMDKVFEIIFYGLCYYNDSIILKKIHNIDLFSKQTQKQKRKSFVFINDVNDSNSEEKIILSKLFGLSFENVDLQINERNSIGDSRFEINIQMINFISKKIFDMFLGNNLTSESESYILSLSNLERFEFKIGFDYLHMNISKKIEKCNIFIEVNDKIKILNKEYFQYKININDYVNSIGEIIDGDIYNLIVKYNLKVKKSIVNYSAYSNTIKKDATLIQNTFKSTNFIQQLNEMLYILSKGMTFFYEELLFERQLHILMDFIILLTNDDYENLVLLSSIDAKNFFDVFKDNKIDLFIREIGSQYYSKKYLYDNYLFISTIITHYIYYIDPYDKLSYKEYINNLVKYSIMTKKENFISNLNHYDKEKGKENDDEYNDFYSIKLKRLSKYNKFYERRQIEEVYCTSFETTDQWIVQITTINYFFFILIRIIESKDFALEENLNIFELIDYKLYLIGKEKSREIYEIVTNPSSIKENKEPLEEFLIEYYMFMNVLLKKDLYQLELVRDSIEFLPKKYLSSYDKLDLKYLTSELNLSINLANQLLIYISFYKTNIFINLLKVRKEDELIKELISKDKEKGKEIEGERDEVKERGYKKINNKEKTNSKNETIRKFVVESNQNENSKNRNRIRNYVVETSKSNSNSNNNVSIPNNTIKEEEKLKENTKPHIKTKEKTFFSSLKTIYKPRKANKIIKNFIIPLLPSTNEVTDVNNENFHEKNQNLSIFYSRNSNLSQILYDNLNETQSDESDNNSEISKTLHDKIIISTALVSYIRCSYDSNQTFDLNENIIKLKNFIRLQLESFDRFFSNKNKAYMNFDKSISLYETFEYTIAKPMIYYTNILKEVKSIVHLSGEYNYDYFVLLTYFLKQVYIIYTNDLNKSIGLYTIKDTINSKYLSFILEFLNIFLFKKNKEETIFYYQIDLLISIFEDVIFILYDNINLYSNDRKFDKKNILSKIDLVYNEYQSLLENTPSHQMTLIQTFLYEDDSLNYGNELVSFLMKNQKFPNEELEDLKNKEKTLIPIQFFKSNESFQRISQKKKIDIRISKLRMYNYFSYMVNLCLRSDLMFQDNLIRLGNETLFYTIYIVESIIEKLFYIIYENSKKSHKNIQENDENLFLVKQFKIAIAYISSSSENFNKTIQVMYNNLTDLYTKLSTYLIKIIYLLDECGIYNNHLKDFAETFTDILLNLFINTTQENLLQIVTFDKKNYSKPLFLSKHNEKSKYVMKKNFQKNENLKRNRSTAIKTKQSGIKGKESNLILKNDEAVMGNEEERKERIGKMSSKKSKISIDHSIDFENSDDNDKFTNSDMSDNEEIGKTKIKEESLNDNKHDQSEYESEYENEYFQAKDIKASLHLDRNNVLVSLFCKIRVIIDNDKADKLLNISLLKTYSNIVTLANTFISSSKQMTKDFSSIFSPSKVFNFIGISIKILYFKYILNFKLDPSSNIERYLNEIKHFQYFKFGMKEFSVFKKSYYADERIFNDELFILCGNLFILLNKFKNNSDQVTKSMFKVYEEAIENNSNIKYMDYKEYITYIDKSSKNNSQSHSQFTKKNLISKTLYSLYHYIYHYLYKFIYKNQDEDDDLSKNLIFHDIIHKQVNENTLLLQNPYDEWKSKILNSNMISQVTINSNRNENALVFKFFHDILESIDIVVISKIEDVKLIEWGQYNKKIRENDQCLRKKKEGEDGADGEMIYKKKATILNKKSLKSNRSIKSPEKKLNFNNSSQSNEINIEISNNNKDNNIKSNQNLKIIDKDQDYIEKSNKKLYSLKEEKEEKEENEDEEDENKKEKIEEKKIKKIYFLQHPFVRLINDDVLENFFENTERTNWLTKISSLMILYKDILFEVKYNTNLKERRKWLYYTLNLPYKRIEFYSFVLFLIINTILLFGLNENNLTNSFLENDNYSRFYYISLILSSIVVIFNLFFLMLYMISKYRFLVNLNYYQLSIDNIKDNDIYDYKEMSLLEYSFNIIKKTKVVINNILLNPTIFIFISNIICGIIGISHPMLMFAYTLLLLIYTRFSTSARLIISAFRKGIFQLIYLVILMAIIIWCFSLTSFFFLNDNGEFEISVTKSNQELNENICNTVKTCFISFFNLGPRNGGGIGDMLKKYNFEPSGIYTGMLFLQVLYFIIVNLLLLNMINGIIINTFTSMSDNLEMKMNDIENKCFICNLDKTSLRKNQVDPDEHKKKQHNIKNYILYFVNVKIKKSKDHNFDEAEVMKCIDCNDYSIFPYENALDWDLNEIKNG